MPLSNDKNIEWEGWLIDGLAEHAEECQKALVAAFKTRNIPACKIRTGTVNMWWREDSRYVDVSSSLDGEITSTVHIQPYGTSLWIGRAVVSLAESNYYKRMAASAFIQTIDRCIRDTVLTMVNAAAVHDVADIGKR